LCRPSPQPGASALADSYVPRTFEQTDGLNISDDSPQTAVVESLLSNLKQGATISSKKLIASLSSDARGWYYEFVDKSHREAH